MTTSSKQQKHIHMIKEFFYSNKSNTGDQMPVP